MPKIKESDNKNGARQTKTVRTAKLKGFTLVELIVVITILAVLATIGFLALTGYSQDAKESAAKANIRSLQTAISSESAMSSNSPRYYIIHDAWAALSGAFAYADGSPVVLTGGNWNVPWTNYSAGNPDYAKLKLNPDKFRISQSDLRIRFPIVANLVPDVLAAYSSTGITVGAFDYSLVPSVNNRPRSGSYFQVTGTVPSTGKVIVTGTYPTSSVTAGQVSGLVKDPWSSSSTGAFVDGTSSTSSSSSSSSSGGPSNSCAANPSFSNVWTLTVWSPTSVGQAWTYSATPGNCTYACLNWYSWTSCATAPAATYPGCDTPDITLSNGQKWAACNAGATTAFVGQTSYQTNAAPSAAQKAWLGAFYQWGRNDDVTTTPTNSTLASSSATAATAGTTDFILGVAYSWNWITGDNSNLWWGATSSVFYTYADQVAADKTLMKGPCAAWYHVPTQKEWNMAVNSIIGADYTVNDSAKYNLVVSTLKLPLPGERGFTGGYDSSWTLGYYWTSSTSGSTYGFFMDIHPSNFNVMSNYTNRGNGFSVRCMAN